jgi:hypothetical protein
MEIQILVLDQTKPLNQEEIPKKFQDNLYLVRIPHTPEDSIFYPKYSNGTLIYLATDPKGKFCSCEVLTNTVYPDGNNNIVIHKIKPKYINSLKEYILLLVEQKSYNVIFGMSWGRVPDESVEIYKRVNIKNFIHILEKNRFRQDMAYIIVNE